MDMWDTNPVLLSVTRNQRKLVAEISAGLEPPLIDTGWTLSLSIILASVIIDANSMLANANNHYTYGFKNYIEGAARYKF